MAEHRIDPLGAPRQPNLPAAPRWYESPWVRRLALTLAGVGLGAACQFIPLAPVRAVCVALAAQLGAAHLEAGETDAGVLQ